MINAPSADKLDQYLDECRDVVAPFLDAQMGHTVTDPKIFRNFSEFWENDYFQDMDDLNVFLPPY